MDNWNLIEVVWTLVAVLGVYYSSKNVIDGLGDMKTLRLTNGIETSILRVTARGNIRRDLIRLVVQFIFAGVGIWAGITPPHDTSLAALIGGLIFVIASGMLTLSTILDTREHKTLLDLGAKLIARNAKDESSR